MITAAPDLSRLDKSFPKDALQAIKSQKVDFTIEVRADYIKGIAKSEYQFGLKGLSDGEELKVGDQFGLTLSCSRRCRARVYYWDGSEAKLIKKFEKVRFGKRKTVSTPRLQQKRRGFIKSLPSRLRINSMTTLRRGHHTILWSLECCLKISGPHPNQLQRLT